MMKKIYINPALKVIEVEDTQILTTSAGGVEGGSGVGNEYNGEDVSYKQGIFGGWDEEE